MDLRQRSKSLVLAATGLSIVPQPIPYLGNVFNWQLVVWVTTIGEVSLNSWSPVWLVWIQQFQYIQITTYFLVHMVRSNPVKLETSHTVILPPTVSVLLSELLFGRVFASSFIYIWVFWVARVSGLEINYKGLTLPHRNPIAKVSDSF